jgi:prevent-host-death family protein
MRIASVQELHRHTSEFVHEAAEGEVIVIERRGEPVAELRPFQKQTPKKRLPDMREVWRRMPLVAADSGRFLEEAR